MEVELRPSSSNGRRLMIATRQSSRSTEVQTMVRILLLTVAAVLVARAQAQKCDPQRTRYAELNRSLIIQNKADAERYPKIKEAATQQLRTLLEQISQQLSSGTFPQLP